jgi:hypothetical protein
VKRTCAYDSMLFACESRSLPSYLFISKPSKEGFDVSELYSTLHNVRLVRLNATELFQLLELIGIMLH